MNHVSGIHRKLNQNDGRQIVDYINKRIEEKAEMERRGIPFFKADSEAFESQDVKRLTILDKLFRTRVNPLKHKRVKEYKITKSREPFWCELGTGFRAVPHSIIKKEPVDEKPKEKKNHRDASSLRSFTISSDPSPGNSPESSLRSRSPPSPSIATESYDDDGGYEDPFNWKHRDIFSDC